MLYGELEDGFVEASAGRLHFKQHDGGGNKIIFLHGIGASTKVFSRLVERLPDDLCFCLIDLLGHGGSDAPEIDYSVELQAGLVREFIEKRRMQDSYLFGHSYGGWIAANIAQGNYRGRGIILEDSVGLEEEFEEVERSGGAGEYKEGIVREALLLNPNEHVIRSSVGSEVPGTYLTRESLAGMVKPSLIIWGSDDTVVPVKYARMFNEYIKGSALEIVEGAGHVAHYTHAETVASLLLRFINNK